jgi:hypothetical protein
MQKEKFIYFNSFAAASVTFTPAGSDEITVTAVDKTAKGNLVSIQVRHDDAAGTVTVTGNAIIIGVGGGGDKGADDIETAFNSSAAATALASISVTGTDHVSSTFDSGQLFLSGGEHARVFPLRSFSGMVPTSDTGLTLFFKSMRNYDGFARGSNEVVVSDSVALTLASNNTHKELMQALTERFNSAQAGDGDIVLGDDRADDTQYLSTLYTAIGSSTLKAANS